MLQAEVLLSMKDNGILSSELYFMTRHPQHKVCMYTVYCLFPYLGYFQLIKAIVL